MYLEMAAGELQTPSCILHGRFPFDNFKAVGQVAVILGGIQCFQNWLLRSKTLHFSGEYNFLTGYKMLMNT